MKPLLTRLAAKAAIHPLHFVEEGLPNTPSPSPAFLLERVDRRASGETGEEKPAPTTKRRVR